MNDSFHAYMKIISSVSYEEIQKSIDSSLNELKQQVEAIIASRERKVCNEQVVNELRHLNEPIKAITRLVSLGIMPETWDSWLGTKEYQESQNRKLKEQL